MGDMHILAQEHAPLPAMLAPCSSALSLGLGGGGWMNALVPPHAPSLYAGLADTSPSSPHTPSPQAAAARGAAARAAQRHRRRLGGHPGHALGRLPLQGARAGAAGARAATEVTGPAALPSCLPFLLTILTHMCFTACPYKLASGCLAPGRGRRRAPGGGTLHADW